MDKIILGILMLKRLTAYEIRNVIRHKLQCNVQRQLGQHSSGTKKLLEAGFVTCSEFVENGVYMMGLVPALLHHGAGSTFTPAKANKSGSYLKVTTAFVLLIIQFTWNLLAVVYCLL